MGGGARGLRRLGRNGATGGPSSPSRAGARECQPCDSGRGARTRSPVAGPGRGRRTRGLPASRAKLYLEIHLAKTRAELASLAPAPERHADLLAAHASLTDVIVLAERLDEPRAQSYALGNLGTLYEAEGRIGEALQLTRRALHVADQASAPDILYRWYWQQGRLLWARGEASKAHSVAPSSGERSCRRSAPSRMPGSAFRRRSSDAPWRPCTLITWIPFCDLPVSSRVPPTRSGC